MRKKLYRGLRTAFGITAALWIIMGSFPTSWIYDLWAGSGAGQGQRPDGQAVALTSRTQIQDLFFQHVPVTASGCEFVKCPLMAIRDPSMAGEYRSRGRRRNIPQYFSLAALPAPAGALLRHFLLNGFYNTYYLLELEDGSYACVFFDDYALMALPFQDALELPTGYIRYASTEEKVMLHQMSKEYDVDVAYVVDMYRYDKVSWIADFALRLGVLFAVLLLALTAEERLKRLAAERARRYE